MTVKTYSGIALEFRAIGNGVLNPKADAWHKAADAIESAAARVAELEAELKALREQKPVGEVCALMFDDSSCDMAELYCNGIYPIGTKLYASPVPSQSEQDDARDAVTLDEIRQAVARAWCNPMNAQKEMDADLAESAATEVFNILAAKGEGK